MPFDTGFTTMFGCRYPIQQAAMGGMTSADLALAVAGAGALGMLSGTVGHQALSTQLDVIPVSAAVGVNFLIPFLDREAVQVAAARSRLVEFFWGTPDADLVSTVHAGGAWTGWQVGSAEEARQAADAGCDVVIAQGMEAGGHVRGTVGLLALLDEVFRVVSIPVIAAGGIGSGRAVAAVLAAGADAVRVGTRFIAATESTAHPVYVDALIDATAGDTLITTAFGDGWPDAPHRVLRSSIEAGERLGPAQSWGPEWPSATYAGDPMARPLYAGQSVGSVRSRQRAADIIEELVGEAERLLAPPRPARSKEMVGLARGHLLTGSDAPAQGELVEQLVLAGDATIEQILSGSLDESVDYDQDHDEWVVLLEGAAELEIRGERLSLEPGDWVLLPRGTPHRLVRTAQGSNWLVIRLSDR